MARKDLPGPSHSRLTGQPRDIDHVLDVLSITGYQAGGELSGRCPLHDDRRASFSINLGTGLWVCHAGCGGGNLAGLVRRVTGNTSVASKRWLRGVELSEPPDDEDDTDDGFWDEDVYFRSFCEPPESALKARRIRPVATADLSIRWAPWTYANGLSGRGWVHDPTWGAWILPVRHRDTYDLMGYQTKIVGEVAEGNEETKTTWGTRKSRTLFGIDMFTSGNPAILVESPLDVAVLHTAGFPGIALASFGASVSRRQLRLLADRAGRIILALDNDRAGRDSTGKLIRSPELAGKELFRFNYAHAPDAKDPGEMTDEEIREGLRTAKRIRR
jgi:hypothetical protein